MKTPCLTMGFVATVAGRRLLAAVREKQSVAGGRAVVVATCGTSKTYPDLLLQAFWRVIQR